MQVRRLNRNEYDVFLGTGFDQWSRVHRYHWGVKVTAGNKLPKGITKEIETVLQQTPTGSIHNIEVDHA